MVSGHAFDDRETPLGRVLDAANVCAWEWEIAADRVTWRAPAAETLAPDERAGTLAACLGLVHPDDRPAVRAALVAAVERDVPVDAAFRVRCPDATVRRMVARGGVARDAAGRAVRVA